MSKPANKPGHKVTESIIDEPEENKTKSRIIPGNPYISQKDPLVNTLTEGKYTLVEMFESAIVEFADKKAMGWRTCVKEHKEKNVHTGKDIITYEMSQPIYLTFKELGEVVFSLAKGMKKFCPQLKKGDRVGLYASTCRQWIMTMYASFFLGCSAVTIYANLGKKNLVKIVKECELEVMLIDVEQLEYVDKELVKQCPTLKQIIYVGETDYKAENLEVSKSFKEVVDVGNYKEFEFPEKPKRDDLAIIMYTSGTTGDPKGVLMTQECILSSIAGMLTLLDLNEEERHCSYLPLAHSFELVIANGAIFLGKFTGYGNPRTLVAKKGGAYKIGDLALWKPTIMCGVPKVWETIKKAAEYKINKAVKIIKWLFYRTVNSRIANLKKGSNKKVFLQDLVFKKVQQLVGGNLRLIISGSAPMSPETQLFMQAVLGKCIVIQGYGLTETTISTTAQDPKYWGGCGTVGYPLPNVRVKIIDCPELGYYVKDNCGEICIKGKPVTTGYYKKPEETKKAIDENNWFHTGDIGKVNKDGTLSIIDRKKNLVKLPHGEYVALVHLEMVYGECSFVQPAGFCVIPDSLKDFLVGIIMLDAAYTRDWANENLPGMKLEEVAKSEKLRQAVLKNLLEISKKHGLAGFERIKNVACYLDSFNPENGTTTASMKIIRRAIKERYKKDIDDMFNKDYGKKPEEKK